MAYFCQFVVVVGVTHKSTHKLYGVAVVVVTPDGSVFVSSQIAACGGSGGHATRPSVSSHPFLPPPSDQTEEQARFECMRLVRAGAISDAELLRLRDQALSWCAVLDWTNGRPSRCNE
jgi:hypothetical protein